MKNSFFLPILLLLLLAAGCSKKNGVSIPVTKPVTGITLINPTRGPAGTAVTIDGQGFIFRPGDTVSVLFNGVKGKVVSLSATQVVAYAPAGGASGAVTVITARGTLTGAVFSYGAPFRIDGATPSFGAPGTVVRLSGIGFGNNPSQLRVYFGATAARPEGSISDTALSVTVPDFAGTGIIRVVVNTDSVSGPLFNYTVITRLNPRTGLDGSVDTVIGAGFSPVLSQNIVTYKGIPATVIGGDTGKLIVKVPSGSSGNAPVAVTINGNTTKLTADDWRNRINVFKDTSLSISYLGQIGGGTSATFSDTITTNQGPVGSFVRIHGYGFGTLPSTNKVFFNGVPVQVMSGGLDTILYVKVPPRASSGPLSMTANGQTVTGPVFTVTPTGVATFAGIFPNRPNYWPNFTAFTEGAYVPLNNPSSVAFDKQYNLYAVDGSSIYKFSSDGAAATVFATNRLSVGGVRGLVFDAAGNGYGSALNAIVKVSSGRVSMLAGSTNRRGSGYVDGQGTAARFNSIGGMAIDASGNLLVVDANNKCIRKISPNGLVTTPYPASFFQGNFPSSGIAVDKAGNIYYATSTNDFEIEEITTSGALRLVAWWPATYNGEGPPAAGDLVVDQNGNIYYSGRGGLYELVNGSPVLIPGPIDDNSWAPGQLAMDAAGNIYTAEGGSNALVRKVILH